MSSDYDVPEHLPLPSERPGDTHRYCINTAQKRYRFYVTANVYEDGRLGEVLITAGKEGSLLAGTLNAVAIALSVGLQHGVPLHFYTSKLLRMQFDPTGPVEGAPQELVKLSNGYLIAKSPLDYLAMYLDWRFPDGYLQRGSG